MVVMMTKLIIYVTVLTIATSPSINYQEKLTEWIVFFVTVLLGSGALIAFNSRERNITFKEILVSLIISLFIGVIAHITMTNFNLIKWRVVVVLLMSFLSEWILNWLKSRYPKIFDWGLKKYTNIDTETTEEK
jgi:hypothetical protein